MKNVKYEFLLCLNVLIYLFNGVLITFWVVNFKKMKSQEIELELLFGDEFGAKPENLFKSDRFWIEMFLMFY